MDSDNEMVVRRTREWVERAVVGLNLCPFAKSVHVKGQVHYALSAATHCRELLDDVGLELHALLACDPVVRETTLLIAPGCLHNFLDFNDFMSQADRLLRKQKLQGVIQLASFHPRYQFAGTEPEDITNFTNRSPYPTIHLLRESSIDRAVQAFPNPESIYEVNLETLRRLGREGWQALDVGPVT